jgi:hypothetical protein
VAAQVAAQDGRVEGGGAHNVIVPILDSFQ